MAKDTSTVLTTENTSDAYVWGVAGHPVAVHLDFDVVDRMAKEVMRGFGVIPRRSVEVGGVLLGSIQECEDGQFVVRVQDFEPVPCRHSRGAGYLLSDEEMVRFEDTLSQWHPDNAKRLYAVGYYRSHSREGLGLAHEDLEIFERYFTNPASVVLLVKPFATRASIGGFFFREDGRVRFENSYREFPFRRNELGGEPKVEPVTQDSPKKGGDFEMPSALFGTATSGSEAPPAPPVTTAPTGAERKMQWVWLPLSFIFLLLGVLVGFMVAIHMRVPEPPSRGSDPFALHLTAAPSGNSVHVNWDRNSAPILASTRGTLFIEDGGRQKSVELDAGLLQNGSIIYNRAGQDLKFRLEIYARDKVTVSESVDLKMDSAPAKRP